MHIITQDMTPLAITFRHVRYGNYRYISVFSLPLHRIKLKRNVYVSVRMKLL